MTGLQETFYIMGIVYMALMFILAIALLTSVFVIRSKIVRIHDAIENRFDSLLGLAEKGGAASTAVIKGAKKVLKKSKK